MVYRLRRYDGEYRWVQDDGSPRYDSTGRFIGYIGHCLDITECVKAERERELLQEQLLQAQKMEAVGRLAGGVAHDFNNMLSVILGQAELISMDTDPSHPAYEDAQEIITAAQHAADLTHQLLAFARKQTVNPQVMDLNDAVSGMLRMLERLIGEDIDLAWMPGDDLWPVFIDPSQIDQIMINLLVNARDAITGVGKITIETDNVIFDDDYCARHAECTPGEYALLAVSDTGHGMDRKALAHIFEPFFTTKEPGRGTGLGLAMVYGIVKQNGGFINVYSEPAQGTTFKIYLPRHTEQDRAPRVIMNSPASTGQEVILLVEDEPQVLSLTQKMLERQGYTIIPATEPEEAIRICEAYEGTIDLLITDVVMPTMNGKELGQRILALQPRTKILYMSGYTANVIAHRGVLDEGIAFIQKPFSVDALGRAVRILLDR